MKNNENICIILVNYNGYDDTVECIKSIENSDYDNYKIILVDNGSKDKNKILNDNYINNAADVIISEENLGFSGGNNLGIKYAQEKYDPEYYLLLNNDTVITKDTISNLKKGFDFDSKAGIITGKIYYFSEPKTIWAAGGKFNFNTGIADQPELGKIDDGVQYENTCEVSFATGCTMLISKQVINTVGYLEESYFLYAEDTDYCCRVLNAGFKIIYVGKALIYHKVSASTGKQSNMQQYYMFRNNCYIIKKYCNKPLYGYTRRIYRTIKEMKYEHYSLRVLYKAWRDFHKGIIGKVEIS